MSEIELEPDDRDAAGPSAPGSTTLRDALSLMMSEGADPLLVVDDAGAPIGQISVAQIGRLLVELLGGRAAGHPGLRLRLKCETENHLFCWGWVHDHWGDTLQPALLDHLKLAGIAVAIGFVIAFGRRAASRTAIAGSTSRSASSPTSSTRSRASRSSSCSSRSPA